ncbi:MAG: hypothetical protein JNM93_13865 [Bacteriovoracaceae bacterium]|nr:hypothetical protein [Bacteriovoracaceae bacterium]
MQTQTNETKPNDEMQLKKLQYLALNFDPYNPYYNHEIENILKEFNLSQLTENPFSFTNRLLQLLDSYDNKTRVTE